MSRKKKTSYATDFFDGSFSLFLSFYYIYSLHVGAFVFYLHMLERCTNFSLQFLTLYTFTFNHSEDAFI